MEKLLTIKEVCEQLQLSAQTLYKMLKSGELQGVRVGKQWRFRESQILEWLERHVQSSNHDAQS